MSDGERCDCHDHRHIPDPEGCSRICWVPVTDFTLCGCHFPPDVFGSTPRAARYHHRRMIEALEAESGQVTFAGAMMRVHDAFASLGEELESVGIEWLRFLKAEAKFWRRFRR